MDVRNYFVASIHNVSTRTVVYSMTSLITLQLPTCARGDEFRKLLSPPQAYSEGLVRLHLG